MSGRSRPRRTSRSTATPGWWTSGRRPDRSTRSQSRSGSQGRSNASSTAGPSPCAQSERRPIPSGRGTGGRTWDRRPPCRRASRGRSRRIRIAHNVAVATGDGAAEQRLRQAIEQALDRTPAASFSQGLKLLGVRVTGSAQPRVESWFEFTGEPPLGELLFGVRSTVVAKDPLSLIPPDPTDREMAAPPSLSTRLWRARFIYVTDAVLNHRLGTERYSGRFRSRDGSPPPERLDGKPQTVLATVE